MVLDDNTLYAGLVGDMTLYEQLTAYTSSTGDPTVTILSPGTLTFGKVSTARHRASEEDCTVRLLVSHSSLQTSSK